MLSYRYYERLFIQITLTNCHTYRLTLVTTFSLGTSRAWFTLESNIKRVPRIKHHSRISIYKSYLYNIFMNQKSLITQCHT